MPAVLKSGQQVQKYLSCLQLQMQYYVTEFSMHAQLHMQHHLLCPVGTPRCMCSIINCVWHAYLLPQIELYVPDMVAHAKIHKS